MRKFVFGLSNNLVFEYKGAMLNNDMDITRLVVHIQQVEKEKKSRQVIKRGRLGKLGCLSRMSVSNRVVNGVGKGQRRNFKVISSPQPEHLHLGLQAKSNFNLKIRTRLKVLSPRQLGSAVQVISLLGNLWEVSPGEIPIWERYMLQIWSTRPYTQRPFFFKGDIWGK